MADRRNVTRFGAEALQLKNVVSRSRKHHHPKLASPVKTTTHHSRKNTSRLINAATSILEPRNSKSKYALTYPHSSRKDRIKVEKLDSNQASCKNCGNPLHITDSNSMNPLENEFSTKYSSSTYFNKRSNCFPSVTDTKDFVALNQNLSGRTTRSRVPGKIEDTKRNSYLPRGQKRHLPHSVSSDRLRSVTADASASLRPFIHLLDKQTSFIPFNMARYLLIALVILCFLSSFILVNTQSTRRSSNGSPPKQLRFDKKKGEFRILQVADMHYADGKKTPCEDVLPNQLSHCSDLNTSIFINRMIKAENPDLIVFTGDNIFGFDATDAASSMNAAFAPAISSNIPWAAVLGNHDQESTLSREAVMKHITTMKNTLSQLNPQGTKIIDGFGNYNLEVHGAEGTTSMNKSILNLYFLDSGDYSTVPSIPGYGWIKPSQQFWFQETSRKLQKTSKAPGLAYFHIPLPEFAMFDKSNFTGVRQEGISSATVNSGFFTALVESGDVKGVFSGHDHVNDFCGKLSGVHLCYGGGFGYHAYGKAGWARRARVVAVSLGKDSGVKSIKTWKRLDDEKLSTIDKEVVWRKRSSGSRRKKPVNRV
ncbi:hypothetical protein LXL04_013669 [Taraxacum kok-saghyz]